MDAVLALAETIAGTKRLILDSFGVALAGAGSRDCLTLVDLVREWRGRAEASVIGHDESIAAVHE